VSGDGTPESTPLRAAWIVVPVAVVMVLFIALLATRDTGDAGFASFSLEGQVAPAIVGTTIDDQPFDLDDFRGRFVVLNFFQTTCIPCVQEHPELVSFQNDYAPSGFATVVSVAFDDRPSNLRDFFDRFGGDWPVLASDTGSIIVDYGVPLVPESIVIAPNGEVIKKLRGGIGQNDLEFVIAEWQEANA